MTKKLNFVGVQDLNAIEAQLYYIKNSLDKSVKDKSLLLLSEANLTVLNAHIKKINMLIENQNSYLINGNHLNDEKRIDFNDLCEIVMPNGSCDYLHNTITQVPSLLKKCIAALEEAERNAETYKSFLKFHTDINIEREGVRRVIQNNWLEIDAKKRKKGGKSFAKYGQYERSIIIPIIEKYITRKPIKITQAIAIEEILNEIYKKDGVELNLATKTFSGWLSSYKANGVTIFKI